MKVSELKPAVDFAKALIGPTDLLHFCGDRLRVCNGDVLGSFAIPETFDKDVFIPAATLTGLMDKCGGDAEIELAEGQIKVRKATVKFPVPAVPGYPAPEECLDSDKEMVPIDFTSVKEGAAWSSDDITRPTFFVAMKEGKVISTNGQILIHRTVENIPDCLLHPKTVKVLCSCGAEGQFTSTSDEWVIFGKSDWSAIWFCRPGSADFPGTEKLFAVVKDAAKIELPESLDEVLSRAAVFCDSRYPFVAIARSGKQMEVVVDNPVMGTFQETITCKSVKLDSPIVFRMEHLIAGLKISRTVIRNTQVKEDGTEAGVYIFENDEVECATAFVVL